MKFYDKQGVQLRAPAIAKFLTSVISYRQVRFRKAFAIAAASREANIPNASALRYGVAAIIT